MEGAANQHIDEYRSMGTPVEHSRVLRANIDDTGGLIAGQTRPGRMAFTLSGMGKLRIAGVIPARLNSTRLSRKVLRVIAGRPMVEWVWRAAAASGLMDPVLVATDSEEVAAACRERLSQGMAKLDPSAPCPRKVTRWRLWVPPSWSQGPA